MIKTHGLAHISLAVNDPERSLRFYETVFGVKEYFRSDDEIQVLGPGKHDVIAFKRDPDNAGILAGIIHFGFRLTRPEDIDAAVTEVTQAGGTILEKGEFVAGSPYAFVADPDGYTVEIWFE